MLLTRPNVIQLTCQLSSPETFTNLTVAPGWDVSSFSSHRPQPESLVCSYALLVVFSQLRYDYSESSKPRIHPRTVLRPVDASSVCLYAQSINEDGKAIMKTSKNLS